MVGAQASLIVRVAAKRQEAVDIFSFELVAADGRALPAFSAGSHVDVGVPGGWTRQYSLCNDPAETHRYLIAVLRDPESRGGSAAMHDRLRVGDLVTISSPKNHFALASGATSSLLLAGGIGITPILCMAERLSLTGAGFDLHYCTRSRDRTAFIERINASRFASRACFHFDDGASDQRLDIQACLAQADAETQLYVCGPKGFMDAVLIAARALGWAEQRLHYEFFAAGPPPDAAGNGTFEVLIASSGRIVTVPSDQTVIQALAAAGVTVPSSCEQGVCGTCMTHLLDGVPDHRDLFLTPEEHAANQQFMPCCSRAKTPRLVLDL